MEGFACRLAQAGLGVGRVSLNIGTLHPQVYGYAWNWSVVDGICDEIQIAAETLFSDAYRDNPIFRVIEFGEVVRVSMASETAEARSPLMEELAATGFSEYVADPPVRQRRKVQCDHVSDAAGRRFQANRSTMR